MTEKNTATLSRPSKFFFPKRDVEASVAEQPLILDMGEASRLEGFRQNGCR